MQINRLRLCNFRQHENTDLELGAGLHRDHRARTVPGKPPCSRPSPGPCTAWRRPGAIATRSAARGAPPRSRVEVELEFSLGAHQYRILRTLNSAELYQDGDPAPIANSIGAVTERVTRLLGMTRDEFFNTYFTGQKELAVMAAMTRAGAGPVPLPRAGVRADPRGPGPTQGAPFRARAPGSRRSAPGWAIWPNWRPRSHTLAPRRARGAARDGGAAGAAEAERRLAEIRPRWEQLQRLRESALTLEAELRVAEHRHGGGHERAERLEREAAEAAAAVRSSRSPRRLGPCRRCATRSARSSARPKRCGAERAAGPARGSPPPLGLGGGADGAAAGAGPARGRPRAGQ